MRTRDAGRASHRRSPRGLRPRLQAAVATLAIRNRVSRRDTAELLRELFGGAELSTGSVDAIISRAGEALAKPHAELLRHVRLARAGLEIAERMFGVWDEFRRDGDPSRLLE